jgi:hypothetical protein
VIANVPWAIKENRIPVAYFGENTCYWTPERIPRGEAPSGNTTSSRWCPGYPASSLPEPIRKTIHADRPSANEIGQLVDGDSFVSVISVIIRPSAVSRCRSRTNGDDPSDTLRWKAKAIVDDFVQPRSHILREVDEFFARRMAGQYVIGVHARGTDATSKQERRSFRQGSLVLARYVREIERLLDRQPRSTIFVASDDQASVDHLADTFGSAVISYDSIRHHGGEPAGRGPTGWIMPAYIAGDRDTAARNGEDAVIEYLLLSRCDHLVHNGSSLARTVLLNSPTLRHTNTHRRPQP